MQRLETGADNDIDADIDDVVSDDIVNDEVGSDDSAAVIIPQIRKVDNSRGRPKLLRTLNRENAYHFRSSLKQSADVIDLGVHATDKSNLDPKRFVRSYLSNENSLDFKYLASRINKVGFSNSASTTISRFSWLAFTTISSDVHK